MELRDTLAELLAVQELSVDDTEMLAVQFRLNQSYDDYHRRFGPLNRFKLVPTGRTKPRSGIAAEGADDGGDESRRTVASPRRWGGFRNDPDHRTVLALEVFDPEGQTATKAPVFRRRVLGPATGLSGPTMPPTRWPSASMSAASERGPGGRAVGHRPRGGSGRAW